MATITAGDFRNGKTFEMDGKVMQVVEFQHVKPGKGAAFVRTKTVSYTHLDVYKRQLIEFPYPSGQGLHVGHPRPFTAMDIVTRKKMCIRDSRGAGHRRQRRGQDHFYRQAGQAAEGSGQKGPAVRPLPRPSGR